MKVKEKSTDPTHLCKAFKLDGLTAIALQSLTFGNCPFFACQSASFSFKLSTGNKITGQMGFQCQKEISGVIDVQLEM